MQDRFNNRLSMFQTALGVLNSSLHKPIWENQAPAIFTTKVQQAQAAYDELVAFTTAFSVEITGSAEDKKREERELEDAAHSLGNVLACWFRDQGDETNAAKVDRPISNWRRLRGNDLIAQATIVRDLGNTVATGPDAVAAADYDITPASVQTLTDEIDDYDNLITAPQEAIAGRKSKRLQMRDRFNAVEATFDAIDTMIIRFDKTPAGRDLIAAYKAGRIVRDLGHGPGTGGGNGGGGNGGGGNGGGTVSTSQEIDLLTQNGPNVEVGYASGGRVGATAITLLWQIDGIDPGFDHATAAMLPLQTVGPFMTGQTVRFKTSAENAAGATESMVKQIMLM